MWVLSFSGNYVNDCPIIGIYNPAGGGGDVGFVLRINENDVYRDLRLSCTGISPILQNITNIYASMYYLASYASSSIPRVGRRLRTGHVS